MRCFPCLIVFSLVVTAWEAQAQTSRANSAASYIYRGNDRLTKGELDLAIDDYNLAIAFDPRSAMAFINRDRIWELKGDLDRALADYSRAIDLDHECDKAFYNRGNNRFAKREMKSAIADFTRAIEINPRHAAEYNNR